MADPERATVVLNAGVTTDPRLKYNITNSRFDSDRVSLDYASKIYQSSAGSLGHVIAYDLSGNSKVITADGTDVYDITKTPTTLGITGVEDVDALLVDDTNDTLYLVITSRRVALAAALAGAGKTVDLTMTSIYLMPNSENDEAAVEQCNYIFDLAGIINWVVYVRRVLETATDSGDGLTFNLAGYDAEPLPAVEVWVGDDADTMVLQSSGYTFNYGDRLTAASVTFSVSKSGKLVKCTYRSKRILTYDEEPATFETLPREQLIDTFLDIAGKSKVVTGGGEKTGPQGVTLSWRLASQSFWDFWREIADNHWHFDIFYLPNSWPDRFITNMFPVKYPDKTHIVNTVPQLVDFAITGMVVE